jgi:tRNA U34 5-carboxymethylaminomethyl modifying enzyme MnmG/GidA
LGVLPASLPTSGGNDSRRGAAGTKRISISCTARTFATTAALASARHRLLKQPAVRLERLYQEKQVALSVAEDSRAIDLASVETTLKYDGYLKQEQARRSARGVKSAAAFRAISVSAACLACRAKSSSVCHRYGRRTLGQASRIPGVTPAAVAVLGVFLGRISAAS